MAATISSKNVTKRNRNGRIPTVASVGSVSAPSGASNAAGGSSSINWDAAYAHSQIADGSNPHATTPANLMLGKYLDASGAIAGTQQLGSIRANSNTTGSTNYPTTFGQAYTFDGATPDRVFTLWKQAGTSNNLYLQTYDASNVAQGWKLFYHGGNANLSTVDWTAKDFIAGTSAKSTSFTSGWAGGSGWKIDSATASMELDDLTIRGTMRVYELLIQQIRATNGSVFVSASAKIETGLFLSGSEVAIFEDPSGHGVCPFATNDIVIIQRLRLDSSTLIKRIVRKVVTVTGTEVEFTTLAGAPTDTGTMAIGDEVVRIGNTNTASRQGLVYLTADDTNAPFIDIVSGVSSWATWTGTGKIKVRLGRLDGITDNDAGLSGSQSNYYGLYSDNVHLKGHIYSDSGKIAAFDFDGTKMFSTNVQLDDNGLKLLNPTTALTTKTIDFYSAPSTVYASMKLQEYGTSGVTMFDISSTVSGAHFGVSFNGSATIVGLTDATMYTEGDLELTGKRVAITCSQGGTGWLKFVNVPTSSSGLTTGMAYTQTVAQVIGSGSDTRKVLMIV